MQAGSDEASEGMRWWIELDVTPSGALEGWLHAANVSDAPVRLPGKPTVTPLDLEGRRLPVDCAMTAEMKYPGYIDVNPGEEAKAQVGWGGWSGDHAGREWEVRLDYRHPPARVEVRGPLEPTARGPATNTYSSWWQLVDAVRAESP